MSAAGTKRKKKSNVSADADAKFYAAQRAQNGGELPQDLIGPDGKPRQLTSSPADKKYRDEWLAGYSEASHSAAGPPAKVVQSCPLAQAARVNAWPALSRHDAPVQAPPPAKKPHHPPCNLLSLTMQCEHVGSAKLGEKADQKREVKVIVKPGAEKGNVLGVVGHSTDKITCFIDSLVGPCGDHTHKVINVYPADDVYTQTDSSLIFDAVAPSLLEMSPLHYIWVTNLESHRYAISASTCDHSINAYVDVYPRVWWTAKLGITKEASIDLGKVMSHSEGSTSAGYKLEGELKVALGAIGTINLLSVEHSKNSLNCFSLLLTTLRILDHTEAFCQKVASVARKGGAAGALVPKVKFDKPGFSAEGSWGWKELEKKPECGFSWEIKAGFTPIIGAEVSVDAVPWLLSAWPALSALVAKSDDDNLFYVAIDLTLGGKLSLTLDSEGCNLDPKAGKTEVDLKGEVSLELMGRVHVGYKVCGISASAEGKLGAKATVGGSVEGGTDEDGPFVNGKLFFGGLIGYACWEAGVDVDWFYSKDKKKREEEHGDAEMKSKQRVTGGGTPEDGVVLAPGREWPFLKKRFAESH